MTVSLSGIPTEIVNIIQDRTLERVFHDALFPRLLYRAEAVPEFWPVNLGERMVFTRAGLIPVSTTPLVAGADPVPSSYAMEQWEAEARQFGNANDTHMPSSYVALAPLFLRNTQQLGLNAGQTLNRIVRDRIFQAYLGGQTNTIAVAAIAATAIQVASINGFTEKLVNGRPIAVGPANPLAVTFTGGEPANTVVGAAPLNPLDPFGPGILTLGAALTVGLALRAGVFANTRSRIVRVGGGATVDALTGANILTLQDIITAVARLRENNVPPCADGFYHIHLTPTGEAEIFADNQFQRLWQSIPSDSPYAEFGIGQLLGCRFYRDTENPNNTNVGTLVDTSGGAALAQAGTEITADVVNQTGVAIQRAAVMGGGAVYEKYLDEGKFLTEAGVTGKIGEFAVTNNGVAVMSNRIRYIVRSPLDRLQQVVSQAWSFSGDWPVPSDGLSGDAARFKRSIVIEHA